MQTNFRVIMIDELEYLEYLVDELENDENFTLRNRKILLR